MNLRALRDRLQDQADEIEPAAPVPLAAVRRQAARIRRRRRSVQAAAGTAAVVTAALLIGGPGPADYLPPAAIKTLELGTPGQPGPPPDGLPSRQPVEQPGDYERHGVRYRAKVADSVLQQAAIGEVAQASVSFAWTPTSVDVDFRVFCTVQGHEYPSTEISDFVLLSVDGKQAAVLPCGGYLSTDPGGESGLGLVDHERPKAKLQVGRTVQISLQLVDAGKRPTSRELSMIGVGIYRQGPARTIGVRDRLQLPVRVEHHGFEYQLSEVKQGPAQQDLSISVPAGTPYLLAYGVLDGVGQYGFELAGEGAGGGFLRGRPFSAPRTDLISGALPPGRGGTTTLHIVKGQATSGTKLLAVYRPVG